MSYSILEAHLNHQESFKILILELHLIPAKSEFLVIEQGD